MYMFKLQDTCLCQMVCESNGIWDLHWFAILRKVQR